MPALSKAGCRAPGLTAEASLSAQTQSGRTELLTMVLMRELHHLCKTQNSSVAVSYCLERVGVLESGFVVRGSLSVGTAQAATHMPREASFSLTELASCMCSLLKGAGLGAAEQGARNFGEKRQNTFGEEKEHTFGRRRDGEYSRGRTADM